MRHELDTEQVYEAIQNVYKKIHKADILTDYEIQILKFAMESALQWDEINVTVYDTLEERKKAE